MTHKNKTVTRQDLADAVHREIGVSKTESRDLVDSLLSIIGDALANQNDVKLARFGNFTARQKKQRMGRNPKTGEDVPIKARRVITFKPSQHMVERMNGGG